MHFRFRFTHLPSGSFCHIQVADTQNVQTLAPQVPRAIPNLLSFSHESGPLRVSSSIKRKNNFKRQYFKLLTLDYDVQSLPNTEPY